MVWGDERSLGRAVTAILDNAVKFSPDGGNANVIVDFNDSVVWVRVSDQGVGIPPEALPKIFERFFHLEQVGKHLFRGVGLGLSIARQVIQLHHGSISVKSELGKGSEFTITLPQPDLKDRL